MARDEFVIPGRSRAVKAEMPGGVDTQEATTVRDSPRFTRSLAGSSLLFGTLGLACVVVMLANVGRVDRAVIVVAIVASILAIATGILGESRAEIGDDHVRRARGGIVLGILTVVASLIVPPIRSSSPMHGRRGEVASNLRQVALAVLQYQNAHGRLPSAVVRDPGGKPLYSWRILVLPWLDQQDLYGEFRLDEAWDSPHNAPLLQRIPRIFRAIASDRADEGTTPIQAFVGPGAMFDEAGHPSTPDVPDGASGTMLLAESATAVPWTAPVDMRFATDAAIPPLGRPRASDGGATFHAAFADGSVRRLRSDEPPPRLRALITRNGGERDAEDATR